MQLGTDTIFKTGTTLLAPDSDEITESTTQPESSEGESEDNSESEGENIVQSDTNESESGNADISQYEDTGNPGRRKPVS